MSLTHAKLDTWTASDGTVFLKKPEALRYIAYQELSKALMKRFALVDDNSLLPQMTVYKTTDLILSLTFDPAWEEFVSP